MTSLANMVKPCLYQKYKNQLGVVGRACSSSYAGGWGRRITRTQEVEVAVIQDPTTALQPGWQSEILSPKKIKNKNISDCTPELRTIPTNRSPFTETRKLPKESLWTSRRINPQHSPPHPSRKRGERVLIGRALVTCSTLDQSQCLRNNHVITPLGSSLRKMGDLTKDFK